MRKSILLLFVFQVSLVLAFAQKPTLDSLMPIRAFAIAAPSIANLDSFIVFIQKELAPRKVNTLILRVDFNYQFKTHPELRDLSALTEADVNRLTASARSAGLEIIPQINLLGHQSWASKTTNLLTVYPQFDETPWVKMPAEYKWPNADSLYCKSYCPLHPDLHKIVFDLVDEICAAFDAKAFHAGMDEVFYLGDSRCPRCKGKDKAKLFADEVSLISKHLATKNRKLWIWGDRLIDGYTTGIGGWEASFNHTWTAIDMIPKDVVICDWHYERPDKSAVYFASKGFQVITCTWNKPAVSIAQAADMIRFRKESTPEMSARFLGVMHTVWSPVQPFLRGYYREESDDTVNEKGVGTQWGSFRKMFAEISKYE